MGELSVEALDEICERHHGMVCFDVRDKVLVSGQTVAGKVLRESGQTLQE